MVSNGPFTESFLWIVYFPWCEICCLGLGLLELGLGGGRFGFICSSNPHSKQIKRKENKSRSHQLLFWVLTVLIHVFLEADPLLLKHMVGLMSHI